MSQPKAAPERMEKIVSLCKRRGFIFQSSEIYGGLNGFWDYGPLGAELKRNVKDLWWRSMTKMRDDVVGLEASIIMHPKIWEASGHTATFADLLVECPITKKRFRADQIEPQSGTVYYYKGARGRMDNDDAQKVIRSEIVPLLEEHLAGQIYTDGFLTDLHRAREDCGDWRSAVEQACRTWPATQSLQSIFEDFLTADSLRKFSVFLPPGKPRESADKVAKLFYEATGVIYPEPEFDRSAPIENTTQYNPENGAQLTEPRMFNLMFKSHYGPIESEENVCYLRPETAQAIFVQFKNVLDVSRQKVPFGIAQIGKAFRNEINPRNFTFRSREFEQMELEFFIKPDEVVSAQNGSIAALAGDAHPGEPQPNWGWQVWHKYWVEERMRWYESIGLPRESLVEYWQTKEDLAHYAKACVDILYKFPFSKRDENGELKGEELEGIAARGDFDLSQHQKHSGKSMEYFDEAAKQKYVPHVIEPSAGVDRLLLALICQAYDEEEITDDKGNKETRVVLRFHPRVAPIKVGIFPLLKNKPELVKKALEVRDLLRAQMTVFYDDGGAIGRRYRRQDEAGTPFGITIDFETLGERGEELRDTVTLRYRDSMKQERVKISELLAILLPQVQ